MAEIDRLLRLFMSSGGEEILFGTGRPICFVVQGAIRPISPAPATTEQIVRVLGEILSPAARDSISTLGAADFSYSPEGEAAMAVHVEQIEGNIFARIRPDRTVAGEDVLVLGEPDAEPSGPAESAVEGTARDFELEPGASEEPLFLEAESAEDSFESAADSFSNALRAASASPPAAPPPMAVAPPVRAAPPMAAAPPVRTEAVSASSGAPSRYALPVLLGQLLARNGSDLHLAVDSPPRIRLHGQLLAANAPPLVARDTESMLAWVLAESQQQRFAEEMSLDFSFTIAGLGRFRANACRQRKGVSLVFRAIPPQMPTFASLGLPPAIETLTNFPNGLILVTGPAGCGKTTTQAAIIDRINETWKDHIITVEDPVEYVHPPKSCLITQREVGTHVRSFAEALKSALREDPDVILVGELRDLETIQLAVTAAETGHLVIGTLHTLDAGHTIDRLIDVFPGRQKSQIRGMVSESLRGVVSQQLLRTADGKGRVAAFEILLGDRSIANMIREAKTFQIPNAIRLGKTRGMCTLDDSILDLYRRGVITVETALEHAQNLEAMRKALDTRPAQPSRPRPA